MGSMTTGAANDLERVTELARRMVCEWGMSEELGPLTFGKREEQIFLGREIAQHQDYSERTAMKIDREVERIVLKGFSRAKEILDGNREALVMLAEALLEYETLNLNEIEKVVKGEKIREDNGDVEEPADTLQASEESEPEEAISPLVKPSERPATA